MRDLMGTELYAGDVVATFVTGTPSQLALGRVENFLSNGHYVAIRLFEFYDGVIHPNERSVLVHSGACWEAPFSYVRDLFRHGRDDQ